MRKLRNAEHFDFFENIIKYLTTKTLKSSTLEPLWNLLNQCFEKEDEIYKRNFKSIETIQICEANEKRKISFLAFKRGVEFYSYSEVDTFREAGILLMEVIHTYGYIYKSPITEISTLFFNMLQDLSKPRYAAAVATTGLTDIVARLERDNKAFKAIYVERTYNLEEIKGKGTMKVIRQKVDEAAVIFTDSINTLYRVNEMTYPADRETKAVLEDIITFFNSFIHQYETIYARRNPRYRARGEDEDEDPLDLADTEQKKQDTEAVS
ncbi:MAG: DUF6261 family protein [Tannerellaceae bacterium]|jgi:transposase-like protein|nr:DUF6261 family protein [Tannerellaceae bacterium]